MDSGWDKLLSPPGWNRFDTIHLPPNSWLFPPEWCHRGLNVHYSLVLAVFAFSSSRTWPVLWRRVLPQPPFLSPWPLCWWPHCVSLRWLRRQPGWHPQDKSLLSIWIVSVSSVISALHRTRHIKFAQFLSRSCVHHYISHTGPFLPSLLICSFGDSGQPVSAFATARDSVYIYTSGHPSVHTKEAIKRTAHTSAHWDVLSHCPWGSCLRGPEIPGSRREGKGEWSKEGRKSNMMVCFQTGIKWYRLYNWPILKIICLERKGGDFVHWSEFHLIC